MPGVNLNKNQQHQYGIQSSTDLFSETKLSTRVSAGKMLATRIRNYLSVIFMINKQKYYLLLDKKKCKVIVSFVYFI